MQSPSASSSVSQALLDPRVAARLEQLVTLARRRPPAPRRRRAQAARGIEPGGRRDYTPGDDTRLLDWSAYARLDRLLIRVTEAQPEPRLDLLLDTSGSMGCGAPAPALRAGLALAGVAACSLARGARVHVWAGVDRRLELRRPGQLVELLRFLARLGTAGPSSLRAVAERLAGAKRPRGAAALFSDALEPDSIAEAARRLSAAGYQPYVVATPPADELDDAATQQALEAGRARLVDAESGAQLEVPLAQASLDQAAARRQRRQRELASALQALGVSLETLAPADPFETIALSLLERRPT